MAAYTTIDDPSATFKVQLWTGNDASSRAITFDDTDTDMQPDFVWIKPRSSAIEHNLYDAPRGVTWALQAHNNEAQGEDNGYGWLSAFGSDGFTVVEGGSNASRVNGDGVTYVAWCWKAGTTSGITTTGSDITPDAYTFNQTSGFSVIKYEGNDTADTQLAHGIGAIPKFGIFKKLDSAGRFQVYHHALDDDEKLYLDDTHAAVTDADAWNETDPTAVNWTIDVEDDANESGEDLVAYSWAQVKGFSHMGSYVGNGNALGTFIQTGFRPAFVMVKITSTTGGWNTLDNKRDPENVMDTILQSNNVDADANDSNKYCDFLSNGFKWRANGGETNGSGRTYIYAAFAEAPFVNSNGVPCNAR